MKSDFLRLYLMFFWLFVSVLYFTYWILTYKLSNVLPLNIPKLTMLFYQLLFLKNRPYHLNKHNTKVLWTFPGSMRIYIVKENHKGSVVSGENLRYRETSCYFFIEICLKFLKNNQIVINHYIRIIQLNKT